MVENKTKKQMNNLICNLLNEKIENIKKMKKVRKIVNFLRFIKLKKLFSFFFGNRWSNRIHLMHISTSPMKPHTKGSHSSNNTC